jgi:hypothetical protein
MRGCVGACVSGVIAGAVSALAGCGWTARDDFTAHRQVVLRPQEGDGSRVTSGWDARRVTQKTSGSSRVAGVRTDD